MSAGRARRAGAALRRVWLTARRGRARCVRMAMRRARRPAGLSMWRARRPARLRRAAAGATQRARA